jgi:hypothetical protein
VALTPDVLMSIGLNAVRQIALTFALVAEHHRGECQQFDYNLHWSRALACGAAMQLLGQQLRIAPPGELFTIGILSSIGQLAMATLHPEDYGALIETHGGPYARAWHARKKPLWLPPPGHRQRPAAGLGTASHVLRGRAPA